MIATKQVAIQNEKEEPKQQEQQREPTGGLITPFCEANLNYVHNELLYILHPRMQIGETVYIENAP